ncbi:tRNA synthetases class I (I, l, M and v) domain-containing protein [Ditylenchus destructor]|uniref:leucine--tRNA ligase n=1 Tax=Ditylenchus destructor TaxID=166010 RepID=A0AAD4R3W7_9BILA|nr:tRNA synthetases class I (I, l, M and v) domain-containing protein [Ditylenchus destructor]
MTDLRSRLSPQNFEKLLFIHHNLSLFQDIYTIFLYKSEPLMKITTMTSWNSLMTRKSTPLRKKTNRTHHTDFSLFIKNFVYGMEGVPFTFQMKRIEEHWSKQGSQYTNPPLLKPGAAGDKTKYILSMFPYPSGNMHMGHYRVYSISDVLSRYYALKGYEVIHPIGWDAFGLPAENAAIERGIDPEKWTHENIETMRKQLKTTGVHFDWDRELFTCRSDYFKWTQWIFLQLYKKGLVRRTMSEVNWDPIDKTVLAAEQVDQEGRSWRSGAIVQKQKRRQWAVETPKYAKRLIKGLEALQEDWKEVAFIQANWIGKCDVFRFLLPIKNTGALEEDDFFDLRLANPVDLSQAEFLIVTPQHALVNKNEQKRENYVLENIRVFNFLNGIEMPVVVQFDGPDSSNEFILNARIGTASDKMRFGFLTLSEQKMPSFSKEQIQLIASSGGFGGYETSRALLDWVVSRQRSWGTPIPMILDESKRFAQPISEEDLPLLSNLRGSKVPCSKFPSGFGFVETDTLDTFFDSAWYFLRYLDPNNQNTLVDKHVANKAMPVNIYVGGVEHADVHLFFARFMSHFLHDLGVLEEPEPFQRFIAQGYVNGKTFVLGETGAFLGKEDVEEVKGSDGETKYIQKYTGRPVTLSYEKMSKSKHNGVDPCEVVEKFGMDMSKMLLLEAAAPRKPVDWGKTQESDLRGLIRFLDRLTWLVNTYVKQRLSAGSTCKPAPPEIEDMFKTVYNVGARDKIDQAQINMVGGSAEFERCIHALVIMLQVFAPNAAAEFWSALSTVPKIQPHLWKSHEPVTRQSWPTVDQNANIELVLAICGTTMRHPFPRNELGRMGLYEVVQLAKENSPLFSILENGNIPIKEYKLERYPGICVTLHIIVENRDEHEQYIVKEMNAHQQAKRKASRQLKKKQREAAAEEAAAAKT